MRCAVVITTYNRKNLLRGSLAAVRRQDYADREIIVVDDASTDGTEDLIRQEFPEVRYLRQEINRGQTASRNVAIGASVADLFVFTDDDCLAPPHWLRSHAAHYRDSRVGIAGGPLETRVPSFCDRFYAAHYYDEYRVFRRIEHIGGWERLVGGNMSVRRSVLDQVGRFDDRFPRGADADLVRRVSRAGYVVISDPTLGIEHLKTYTLRSFLTERFYKACGSVMTDVKEGTLSARRFVPVVNVIGAWQDWRNFRAMFGGSPLLCLPFWALAVVNRWVEVAGRAYYYRTVGRFYRSGGSS